MFAFGGLTALVWATLCFTPLFLDGHPWGAVLAVLVACAFAYVARAIMPVAVDWSFVWGVLWAVVAHCYFACWLPGRFLPLLACNLMGFSVMRVVGGCSWHLPAVGHLLWVAGGEGEDQTVSGSG